MPLIDHKLREDLRGVSQQATFYLKGREGNGKLRFTFLVSFG
jgi:hypothetical protein